MIGIIIIFVVHAIFSHAKKNPLPAVNHPTINVKTVKVQYADVPHIVQAMGSLDAAEKVDISPQIAGQIKAVLFKNGDTVQKGQVLYQLDDSLYLAKLQAVQSDLVFSKITYQRFLRLMNTGAVSKQMLDKAKSNYLDAQSAFAVITVDLKKTMIKAPFSGVVGASLVDAGQYVTVGQTLLTLVDKSNLVVKFSIPENKLNAVSLNQPVMVRSDTTPGHLFQGMVSYISPSIDPTTRTVMVWATVPNVNNQLAPGLFVHAQLTIGDMKNSLLIPQEALIPTIEGNNVFIVKHRKAYQQSVEIGDTVGDNVIVLKGLTVGDVVVTAGQEKLSSGRSVKVLSK